MDRLFPCIVSVYMSKVSMCGIKSSSGRGNVILMLEPNVYIALRCRMAGNDGCTPNEFIYEKLIIVGITFSTTVFTLISCKNYVLSCFKCAKERKIVGACENS